MTDGSDPVDAATPEGRDLYDIATWEPRTAFDRLATRVHSGLVTGGKWIVVLTALLILISQFALTGLATVLNPMVGVFTLLSILPAFALAAYLWWADITTREPTATLVVTFVLGVLFAGFAAVLNGIANPLFEAIPFVGLALFFYLIVAPIEETVKWLAVRLYAFRTPDFDAVLDGAVYGAVAGLGFATIENASYIGEQFLTAMEAGNGAFDMTLQTAAVRSLAGPGHVIYSAFAGYYLGLAKFNRENAGPIVVKGLLIAALVHGTYNTAVTYLPVAAEFGFLGMAPGLAFLGFIVVYDGAAGFVLYRKILRYRRAYREADAGPDSDADADGDGGDHFGEEWITGAGGEDGSGDNGGRDGDAERGS